MLESILRLSEHMQQGLVVLKASSGVWTMNAGDEIGYLPASFQIPNHSPPARLLVRILLSASIMLPLSEPPPRLQSCKTLLKLCQLLQSVLLASVQNPQMFLF